MKEVYIYLKEVFIFVVGDAGGRGRGRENGRGDGDGGSQGTANTRDYYRDRGHEPEKKTSERVAGKGSEEKEEEYDYNYYMNLYGIGQEDVEENKSERAQNGRVRPNTEFLKRTIGGERKADKEFTVPTSDSKRDLQDSSPPRRRADHGGEQRRTSERKVDVTDRSPPRRVKSKQNDEAEDQSPPRRREKSIPASKREDSDDSPPRKKVDRNAARSRG